MFTFGQMSIVPIQVFLCINFLRFIFCRHGGEGLWETVSLQCGPQKTRFIMILLVVGDLGRYLIGDNLQRLDRVKRLELLRRIT